MRPIHRLGGSSRFLIDCTAGATQEDVTVVIDFTRAVLVRFLCVIVRVYVVVATGPMTVFVPELTVMVAVDGAATATAC